MDQPLAVDERDGVPFGRPDGWKLIFWPAGMSNLDHAIEDGFEDALRAGGVYGKHAGWEFNGEVWFQDGRFYEQVWRHHVPQQTISATTLQGLMKAVNDEWGWA